MCAPCGRCSVARRRGGPRLERTQGLGDRGPVLGVSLALLQRGPCGRVTGFWRRALAGRGWESGRPDRRKGLACLPLHVIDEPPTVVDLHVHQAFAIEVAVGVLPRLDPEPQHARTGPQRRGQVDGTLRRDG